MKSVLRLFLCAAGSTLHAHLGSPGGPVVELQHGRSRSLGLPSSLVELSAEQVQAATVNVPDPGEQAQPGAPAEPSSEDKVLGELTEQIRAWANGRGYSFDRVGEHGFVLGRSKGKSGDVPTEVVDAVPGGFAEFLHAMQPDEPEGPDEIDGLKLRVTGEQLIAHATSHGSVALTRSAELRRDLQMRRPMNGGADDPVTVATAVEVEKLAAYWRYFQNGIVAENVYWLDQVEFTRIVRGELPSTR